MYESDILPHPVVLFDGFCNLCSRTVQIIIENDSQRVFRFASLQSLFGQEVLNYFKLDKQAYNTFFLLENGRLYDRSTAALRVARRLNGGWKLLTVFSIVPRPLRDGLYNYIARRRYKWFGQHSQCWMPNEELKKLFYT